jgi:transposase
VTKKARNIIRRLEEENRRLKEENAYLKFELQELKNKLYKRKSRKSPPPPDSEKKPFPKKKGGLFGHIGWFRRKPKRVDRIEEVRLDKCSECGSPDIIECTDVRQHIQQDIILPKVEATLYRKHRYYCKNCKKIVTGLGKNELLKSYIGPRAKTFAAFLKYVVKVSERDIRNIFDKAFNLKVSPSGITGFRDRITKEASLLYDQLVEKLKNSKFIHIDETGWKINGRNCWLWKLSNKKVSVTHINKSRGKKVVDSILGKGYKGVLISDFLAVYNKVRSKAKQRCLAHIIRDLKRVIEYWADDEEVLRYARRLKKIFENAIELYKEYIGKRWDNSYYSRRKALTNALRDFNFPNPNKRILQNFAKRLQKHKDELFSFLYEKDIDFHNNHAEQQIRPDVIFRKITFGNRSERGAQNHNILMSILQTAKLNNLDPLKTLHAILLPKGKNPFSGLAVPP